MSFGNLELIGSDNLIDHPGMKQSQQQLGTRDDWQSAIASVVLCICLGTAGAQEQLPTDRFLQSLEPTADVNDFAGLLTPSEKEVLEGRCKDLREKTSAQLAVVT